MVFLIFFFLLRKQCAAHLGAQSIGDSMVENIKIMVWKQKKIYVQRKA
jgi:hypothetical protein